MKLFKIKSLLGALAMMAMILTSCSDDSTNPVTPGEKPEPVANVYATSINDNTVKLKWDASPSETNSLFKCYVIDVLNEDGSPSPIQSMTLGKGTSVKEISNLTEGTVYLFQVRAQYTTDSLSTATTIKWSPATRFTTNDNDGEILIYEYASDYGSGLSIFDAAQKPKNLKASSKADWNLGIDTRDGKLLFGSASQINIGTATPTAKTEIGKDYWEAANLSDVFDSKALNTTDFSEQAFDLSTISTTGNIILVVRVKNGTKTNYAKVMIMKSTNGTFLWDSKAGTNNRYVKLEISYQKGSDVPYAKHSVK